MNYNNKLSVIIIAKNEEKNISKCIESVLAAIEGVDHEIILVDSASTDNTIDIAKKYPITILQLKPEWPLSAAAARYIGFLHSKGKYIQFQDGDTTSNIEWFKHSIEYLKKYPDVGGVVGISTQEEYDNIIAKRWMDNCKKQTIGNIHDFGANILLRRHVLEKVGAFNPYLKSLEEGELSYRILDEGYKLVRIPAKMFHHLGGSNGDYKALIKRKQNFSDSCGQIFRYSLSNKNIFHMHWNDAKDIFIFSFLMLATIIYYAYSLVNGSAFKYMWLAWMLFLFLSITYKKRNVDYAVKHFISLLICWPYFLKGFFKKQNNMQNYPINVKVIKIYKNEADEFKHDF